MFIVQMPPPLSHGLMTMDWLILRLLSGDFSFHYFAVGLCTWDVGGDEVLFNVCKEVH